MTEHDRISKFFEDRTIFITGGTGFLGKVLIEKFLRCCNVKKIYLLVRTKKGKAPHERLDDIFSNVLFDLLKSQNPTSLGKCQIISGDVTQDFLGISDEDRHLLQNEIEFIYHSAASTRFDDTLKTAIKFNTKGTNELLDIAEKCQKLMAFVHVSTAYAFPGQKVLYEKAYTPPDDPKRVLDIVRIAKDDDIGKLLRDSPNTYTYSKALAEAVVVERMGRVPAIIVRPSVVCPVWGEPLRGWCNNLQGPMGLFVGAGKGIIRSMYMKGEAYADFVPADLAVNGMLVCTWNFVENSKRDNIINLTSSADYNYTWEELIQIGKDVIYNIIPFNGIVWYPGGSIKKSRFVHNICFYLFQMLPALFIDALLIVLGYKPVLFKIQKRIQKGNEVFEYYTNRPWNFSHMKLAEIRDRLNQIEKKRFKMDGDGLELKEYLTDCIKCVRRNNLKESDDTLPAAKRHMMIMWMVDILFKIVLALTGLHYFYHVILKSFYRI